MPDRELDIAPQKFDADMPDYSDPDADDFVALSRDKVMVRSLMPDDLPHLARIDRKLTGMDRTAYYERKLEEVTHESGIRVSLVAEVDGLPAGFIMARVDFGEYGRAEPMAVIDTLGVHPGHGRGGIASALLSQLLTNLNVLHVETVRSTVSWDNFTLLRFMQRNGFTPSQRLILRKRVD